MSDVLIIRQLKDKANKLPLQPGVYMMKNKQGQIIYVGKAKSLKNRVTQYFGSNTNHTVKVIKMVENIADFEIIICDSEYESLVLENSLIKQHQPKYNILLKDDKGYNYIKVTNDKWQKIKAVKSVENDGSEYIGPYYSFSVVRQTVDEVLKIYKLPNCGRDFDKKSKPCLNYHIGLCFAPCKFDTKLSEYKDIVNSAVKHIKNGGIDDSEMARLNSEMIAASDKMNFELAARIRDRIKAIEKSQEKQKVILSGNKREDVIASVSVGETSCISILIFKNGHLSDKHIYFVDVLSSKTDVYSEFLLQYYTSGHEIPPVIAIDDEFNDKELIAKWLSELRGSNVSIYTPKRAVNKQLIDMCKENASQAIADKLERNSKETSALSELSELLGLEKTPTRIESYDISNTAGSENVASMVVFINGRYEKSLTRKFKIKSFVGQNDFRSLAEVIERRINEYLKGEDDSYKNLPDLILLDGGKGQISAIQPILNKYELNIPLFGMVKDSKHKTRAITSNESDIQISAKRKAFTLVTSIQDEVHRVAVSYHHQRNRIYSLKTELTQINGIGDKTAAKLLRTFKSIKRIKEADLQVLLDNGFSEKIAHKIIDYYKK